MRLLTNALLLFACFSTLVHAQIIPLPPRPLDAPDGSTLISQLTPLSREERESVLFTQVMQGNIPDFQRTLIPITVTSIINGTPRSATFFALPDYLALGTNENYVYMPMTPLLAQRLANALHCTLPTRRMVDTIYARASVKLRPQPIPPSSAMTTVPVFAAHNDSIQQQRAASLAAFPLGALTGGDKKDVILSALIYSNLKAGVPKPVVIYGWHQLNGLAIQPAYNGHGETYVDYSHGIRFVLDSMMVDGTPAHVTEILRDPLLNVLLSDEGALSQTCYSLASLAPPAPRSFGIVPESSTLLRVAITPTAGVQYSAFLSSDGLTFSDSVQLNSTGFLIAGWPVDSVCYVRIRATDELGVSAFSEVLAATPTSTSVRALLVHGFDRASVGNQFNFIRMHAAACHASGLTFASATNDAVVQGLVRLQNYSIADYILGDESTANETFSTSEQDTVAKFLRGGGSLLVSGAEIAWDLDFKGSAADKLFFNDFLKARYISDSPNNESGVHYLAEPTTASFLNGLGSFNFDNGTHGTIDVRYPDVIEPVNGGSAAMQYSGLSNVIAGVSYRGVFPGGTAIGNVVYFGFPFESIYPETARNTLFARILAQFSTPDGIADHSASVPGDMILEQNYPNPFNAQTTVRYRLANAGTVSLRVHDILGREIATLVDETQLSGNHDATWNAATAASGTYICTLQADGRMLSRSLILIK